MQFDNIDDHILADKETPESIIIKSSQQLLVQDAISILSPNDREIVYLYFYEELKYHQISEIMDIPVGTIKSKMYQIRKKLKAELQRSLSYE